ncbi:MAG: cytochrome C oxidase subunit IV family protein [Myxococcota bacterium]
MAEPVSRRTLVINTGALLALTGLSWGLAHVSLGAWEMPVALGIAAVKVALVALFFMHLVRERGGVRFAAATAPIFIALLTGLLAADVLTR